MKVVITGGSGFIGTRLIGLLSKFDHIKITNYDKIISEKYPELTTVGDVRDVDSLIKACVGADVIYNLAAEHADNVTPLSLYRDVNVDGAENVVRAALANDVKKIVFTSTVAIYGLNRGTPDESFTPEPFNEYGRSKLQAEEVFNAWHKKQSGSSLITVRPAVVFGEDNRGNVYNLINQIVSGRFLMIGNGENCKSMGYVGNVASFLQHQLDKGKGYYVYNYADKEDLSSAQIVSIVREEMGIKTSNVKVPYILGILGGYAFDVLAKLTGRKFSVSSVRIKKFCADTTVSSSAAISSGFTPPYSLEEGLKRMIRYEFK